jgi:phospholipid/cholesterol/gamma-HCH transport system substrate-binding protein
MIKLRHTDEWVGLVVVLATVVFLGAVLQAGLLRDWFRPVSILRVLLPEAGVGGLSVGAEVEVLGTQAGKVRRIVIDPDQRMYAEAEIDDQARAFIRRDSKIIIRRRYGVAGAAFLDISRGTGTPLDWEFAVLEATTERAPTESIGALIDEARQKIFPIVEDVGRTTHALAAITERLERGEGDLGRLLKDETLVRQAEATVADVRQSLAGLGRIVEALDRAAQEVQSLVQAVRTGDSNVPSLLKRTDAILANVQVLTRDIARATPRVPQIAQNVERSTANLPALLTQTQQTAMELEALLTQLRGHWLLGGEAVAPPPRRLSPTEVRP